MRHWEERDKGRKGERGREEERRERRRRKQGEEGWTEGKVRGRRRSEGK